MIGFQPDSFRRGNTWEVDEGGDPLWRLTPEELERVPVGTTLTSIFGNKSIVGVDKIDTDTRFGYIAHGVFEYQF